MRSPVNRLSYVVVLISFLLLSIGTANAEKCDLSGLWRGKLMIRFERLNEIMLNEKLQGVVYRAVIGPGLGGGLATQLISRKTMVVNSGDSSFGTSAAIYLRYNDGCDKLDGKMWAFLGSEEKTPLELKLHK